MPAKNLVLLSIDDLRAVSQWGHFSPLVVTPNIDRLAELGTTFERAITQVPLCNPSRTSVFSGQQPSQTGVLNNEMLWYDRVDPADTLPAVLKDSGVYVAMYGKHFHEEPIPAEHQQRMFDEFLYPETDGRPEAIARDEVYHNKPYLAGRYTGDPAELRDAQTVAAAIDFLEDRAGEQPFLLGVGITRPHLDWTVPPEFYDLYDPAAIREALELSLQDGTILPGLDEYFDVPPLGRAGNNHAPMAADHDLWADYIHGYLAAVSYADAQVGAVLDTLEADPELAAETAILLWSDHGFHLGDKDRWQKSTQWRETTEAPMIVVEPGQQGGQTAEQVVSLVDIFPTVLDILGVDTPERIDLAGNSLRPIVEDALVDWYDPEAGKGVALTTIFGAVSIRAVVPEVGDLRYTRYPDGTVELYNLTNDPDEHVNRLEYGTGVGLTPEDDALRATMDALMDDQLVAAGVHFSNGVDPIVGTEAGEMFVSHYTLAGASLEGGAGDDTYVLYRNATIVEADDGGFDSLIISNPGLERSFKLPQFIELVQVAQNFTGNAYANRIYAEGGGGTLSGGAGDDTVRSGNGNYTVNGNAGRDVLSGQLGADKVNGGDGYDTLYGGAGADTLSGGTGSDVLFGDAGKDRLSGDGGADTLTGGAGDDVFAFAATTASSLNLPDVIADFTGAGIVGGDRIDLSAIDADETAEGDQAFVLNGSGPGRAWFATNNGDTMLLASSDADDAAELRIIIRDGVVLHTAYTAGELIL